MSVERGKNVIHSAARSYMPMEAERSQFLISMKTLFLLFLPKVCILSDSSLAFNNGSELALNLKKNIQQDKLIAPDPTVSTTSKQLISLGEALAGQEFPLKRWSTTGPPFKWWAAHVIQGQNECSSTRADPTDVWLSILAHRVES